MKNSIVYFGVALASLINVCNASNVVDKQSNPVLTDNTTSNKSGAFGYNFINSDSIDFEAIDSVRTSKIEKATDELIAEDNAITGNNISNETQVLDFSIINKNSIVEEVVESVNADKIEKTTDELIAEDNAITGNNISNEVQVLDFNVINSNSNPLTGKNKSFLVIN